MPANENFIQRAIKRPGALRIKAQAAHAITSTGTISKQWLEQQKAHGSPTTKRQANLALTLRKFKHKRSKSK